MTKRILTTSVLACLSVVSLVASSASAAKKPGKLKVTSTLFKEGGTMPMSTVFKGMGCTGENVSPDLKWEGAPEGTKSFAVVVHDPDAPTGVGFFHWTIANIPATATELPAGAGADKSDKLPAGAVLAYTDFGMSQYGGPCPPPGKPHRYEFVVYALDVDKLDGVGPGATGALLRFMVGAHTLAEGKLTGKYGR